MLQIGDRCTAGPDTGPVLHRGEEEKICGLREGRGRGGPWREQPCASADISLKEQGEIRALQKKKGEGGRVKVQTRQGPLHH